ncbi:MAG: MBL fold metallo-hydrolase [Candidatus Riflebacteria bacterium]|nr:MBL fold metallo-hydrolase [Candidatus Riflebacteria bacterium]
MSVRLSLLALFVLAASLGQAVRAGAEPPASLPADTFETASGPLEITFVGHGTLMMRFGGKVIHIDPYAKLADYATLPKADLILLTHHHQDHLDLGAIAPIRTPNTRLVLTASCAEKLPDGEVMKNGDRRTEVGVGIEAVPAYNLLHKRDNGQPFHPRGEGNGYVLTFGATRVYVAGDTENTPEMKALTGIDVAFLPMNLPYTMTPDMVSDAARALKPKVLYPYHYGETDPASLTALLADLPEVEVRIRPMR